MAEQSRERWSVCQQDFVSRERNDKVMKQTTRITIEHIVVASDRSYEQVLEALEAQLGLRADWDKITRELITFSGTPTRAAQYPNPEIPPVAQLVEQKLEELVAKASGGGQETPASIGGADGDTQGEDTRRKERQ